MYRHCRFGWLALALAGFCGCSSGDGRMAIQGQVTVDGRPVEMATISFQPLDEQGHSSGTSVENGRFQLEANAGLQPGTYRVQVQAFRKTGKKGLDPQRGVEIAESVPVALKDANGQQITVQASGENTFSLNYTSAPH